MKIAQLRLTNQRITGHRGVTPDEVVRHLGAVQAQDYVQALWAVGLRMPAGTTVSDVEQALRDGTIVRTWIMRGTLHLVPAEDVGWMLKLFGARAMARITPKAWAYHTVDMPMMTLAEKTCVNTLRGGKVITRAALIDVFQTVGIPNDRQQSYFIFGYLCHAGLLCPGPPQGKEQTFALLDEWAPRQRELTLEESIVELAKRFFPSHGPATLADFANWTGLKMPEAQQGLEAVKGDLVLEHFGGKEYWLPSGSQPGSGTHLLPAYDELLIGYKDRNPSYERYGPVPISTHNAMFFATAVEDGQVIALWKRTFTKTRVTLELRPVAPISEEQVRPHADEFGRFLGIPSKVVIKPVEKAGPMPKGFQKAAG